MVVALGSLRLNVLLDGVDLALVLDQLLLDVVQTVVDLRLKDLVLLGVVPHRVVSHLLRKPVFVRFQESPDRGQALLLSIELHLQVVSLRELVIHVVLHRADLLAGLVHFFVDSSFEVLYLLKIVVDGLLLDLEPGSS